LTSNSVWNVDPSLYEIVPTVILKDFSIIDSFDDNIVNSDLWVYPFNNPYSGIEFLEADGELRVHSVGSGSGMQIIAGTTEIDSRENFSQELEFTIKSGLSAGITMFIGFNSGDKVYFFVVTYNGTTLQALFIRQEDGDMIPLGTVKFETKYKVRIDYNAVSGKFEIYLNNLLAGTYNDVLTGKWITVIGVDRSGSPNGALDIRFDNFKLSGKKEKIIERSKARVLFSWNNRFFGRGLGTRFYFQITINFAKEAVYEETFTVSKDGQYNFLHAPILEIIEPVTLVEDEEVIFINGIDYQLSADKLSISWLSEGPLNIRVKYKFDPVKENYFNSWKDKLISFLMVIRPAHALFMVKINQSDGLTPPTYHQVDLIGMNVDKLLQWQRVPE